MILQVLVLPVTGAIADRAGHQRQLLATFAAIGSVATMLMVVLTEGRYVLGGVLFVVANLAFGMSVVVYNAFLPQISTPDERDRVSSRGWALGYLGGAVLLVVNLALYLGHETFGISERDAVRISLLSAGIWWALFTVIPVVGLRGVRRPAESDVAVSDPRAPSGGVLTSGFRQLASTLRDITRYPQTLLFLLAYLLYNDGIQTVIALAAVYIEKELLLDTSVSISVILLVQIVAFAGALALGRLAARWGAQRVILGALVVWGGVLVVAFLLPQNQVAGVYGIAAADRVRPRWLAGPVEVALLAADPPQPGGRVLRVLRDLRARHQLARHLDLRTRLRGVWFLPRGHRRPGGVLRGRWAPAAPCQSRRGDRRRR